MSLILDHILSFCDNKIIQFVSIDFNFIINRHTKQKHTKSKGVHNESDEIIRDEKEWIHNNKHKLYPTYYTNKTLFLRCNYKYFKLSSKDLTISIIYALSTASIHGYYKIIKYLINYLRDNNLLTAYENDILHCMHNCVRKNHISIFKYLSRHTSIGENEVKRMIACASCNGYTRLLSYLCRYHKEIATQKYHLTSISTDYKKVSTLKFLCKQYKPNILAQYSRTSIFNYLVDEGKFEIVKYICNAYHLTRKDVKLKSLLRYCTDWSLKFFKYMCKRFSIQYENIKNTGILVHSLEHCSLPLFKYIHKTFKITKEDLRPGWFVGLYYAVTKGCVPIVKYVCRHFNLTKKDIYTCIFPNTFFSSGNSSIYQIVVKRYINNKYFRGVYRIDSL